MSANLQKLIAALVTPMQDIEDALWDLLVNRSIETAEGAQLDQLGYIVGEPRRGLDDEAYRRHVRARVATNKSSGRVNELYEIARLVLNDDSLGLRAVREGPATLRVTIDGAVSDDVAGFVIRFLRDAGGGGVRIVLQHSSQAPADLFQFDDGPGFDQGILANASE